MTVPLSDFWETLETSFPLGGPRRLLRERLGPVVCDALELEEVLSLCGESETYPCPHPGGDHCPRVIVRRQDRSLVAICGNEPAECEDLEVSGSDIERLALSPEFLLRVVARSLSIRSAFEALPGLQFAFRVGFFVPEPGVKHAIYFVARASPREYEEAVDALRSQTGAGSFAVLVPTDRFVSEALRQRSAAAGVPLISLLDCVAQDAAGAFTALADPLQLFSTIGRRRASGGDRVSDVVATAFLKGRGQPPERRDLDAHGYQALLKAIDTYDVFADERARTVSKTSGGGPKRGTRQDLPASYFQAIRAALEARRDHDPGTGDFDKDSAKQIFQRARGGFDLKRRRGWAIFKTLKRGEHAVYRHDPDADVSYAFVFLPEP